PGRLKNSWYTNALSGKNPVSMYGFGFNNSDIAEMCVEFLRGMKWVSQYYFKGQYHITWEWFYPYYYSPMLIDVLACVNALEEQALLGEMLALSSYSENVSITAAEQLVAVM